MSRSWVFGLIIGLLLLIVFKQALVELVGRWSAQEEYSHGYLVPLVAAWLLWARRDIVSSNIGCPTWSGTLLVAAAMLLHIVGKLSNIFIFSQLAFVLAIFGIILASGGYPLLRTSFIPVAFLFFAIPLPTFINAGLSLELQLVSSRLGVALIRLFQVPVYLEGNLIDLGTEKLQVVEACSGLRYLFPFLSLSFLAAYLFQAPVWQRAILLVSSIPITIAMNGFRIGVTGVAVDRWGPRAAEGMLHLFEGWIIFVVSILLLLLEVFFLVLISGIQFSKCFGLGSQSVSPVRATVRPLKPFYACLFLIIATLFINAAADNRLEVIPQRNRFVTFPADIGGWRGHNALLEPEVEHMLDLDDYILSDYNNPDGDSINLYVAYYSSQHRSKYHSPLVCIPGDGWSMTAFDRTSLGSNHPINRAIIERDGSRKLVYYWYEERGRKVANEYWSRLYLIYDTIARNRSDGALIRLVTQIMPNEGDQDGDARLKQFVRDLEPSLQRFLGPGDPPETAHIARTPKFAPL